MSSVTIPGTASVAALVAELERRGVELRPDGTVLNVSAPKGAIDRELAQRIAASKPEILSYLSSRSSGGPTPLERSGPMPLGTVQQRMWVHQELEPDTVLYNLPAAWRLKGALDVAGLERAINAVVRRHEVLRISLHVSGGELTQTFAPSRPVTLDVEDLSGLTGSAQTERLTARLNALRDRRIDLSNDLPFTMGLFTLGADDHVLFFSPHHVVWDGWSFDIFLRDLNEFLMAEAEGREARLPALPIQYADYAMWHRAWLDGGAVEAQVGYWTGVLDGDLAPLEVAADFQRPPVFSHRGDWVEFELSAAQVDAVRRLATAHRSTSFMVLLAAWYAVLYRISAHDDIVIGVPIQARQRPEVADLIGCFVNTLCLRQRIDPEAAFGELVDAVRDTCLAGYERQDAPVELLVDRLAIKRDTSRTPLFQAMFSHQQTSRRPRTLGNLSLSQVHVNPAAAPTDLMLAIMEGASTARGVLHYSTDLFTAETVRGLRDQVLALLDSAISEPQTSIARLSIVSEAQRAWLADRNATTVPYSREVSLAAFLRRSLEARPDGTAVIFDGREVTCRELLEQADRVAGELRGRELGPGSLVGICLERNVDLLAALLGVIQSGAAYVPLDPTYPADRLSYMIEDSRLALVVTDSLLASGLNWPSERSLWMDHDPSQTEQRLAPAPFEGGEKEAGPEDPAYVIYTSGSTGKPKGVMVPNRAAVNFLESMARVPGLGPSDKLLAVTTLSFDISVLELLLPISVGAPIVLASRDEVFDGHALRDLLDVSGATAMQATPATWRMLIDAGWSGGTGFKALVGGEPLPVNLANALLQRSGELWNMYGPTETTVWSTCWRVESPESGISIGQPIANTTIWILDARGQLCPAGVPGEVYIGGEGVALGYLGRPELTAERFISGLIDLPGVLYRTGDRGRWMHDGQLEHLGRLDSQVKVRGHRIELGEIETNLASHPGVSRCVVVVREDQPGDTRLVAYIVAADVLPTSLELREHLRAKLPEYMVPQHFVPIVAIPLLPNGKIAHKALPQPSAAELAPVHARLVPPRTDAEVAIAEIWSGLLGVRDISVTDNFFDLGGHSLLAVSAVDSISRRLGRRIHVRRLIFDTLEQIAADVEQAAAPVDESPGAETVEGRSGWLRRVMNKLRS